MQQIVCKRNLWICGIVVLTGLFVISCTFHQKLPEGWVLPPSVPEAICPDISGNYNNHGERADKEAASLAQELFKDELRKDPSLPLKDTTHISIQQQDQTAVHISAWSDKKVIYSKTFSRTSDDFSCEDGWLRIASFSAGGGGAAIGAVWDTRWFARSDGHLLEKIENNTTAIVAVIPLVMSSRTWCRFAETKDGNAKNNVPAAAGEPKN